MLLSAGHLVLSTVSFGVSGVQIGKDGSEGRILCDDNAICNSLVQPRDEAEVNPSVLLSTFIELVYC